MRRRRRSARPRAPRTRPRRAALMAEVAALKEAMAKGEDEQRAADKALHDALSVIPNMPREDVPEGKDEHGNMELRKVGAPPKLAGINKPLQHFEIGERAGPDGLRDGGQAVGRAVRGAEGCAGAHGARAGRVHARSAHGAGEGGIGGYTEIAPPILVRDDAMFGTAQLPKFRRISSPPKEMSISVMKGLPNLEALCRAEGPATEDRGDGDPTSCKPPLASIPQTVPSATWPRIHNTSSR